MVVHVVHLQEFSFYHYYITYLFKSKSNYLIAMKVMENYYYFNINLQEQIPQIIKTLYL